ncbi:hypothetical protein [Streptomyces sp. NPDC053560]|uniref:hypothetical protein n=1 Tax=Streptomyces sp. NPDC053560 TaxID=3365711 RepID=UPI0037D3A1D3
MPRRRNEKLRALLAEARWTQSSLARSVNALAAEIGLNLTYDRTAVAHWLSGTQPVPPVPALVAEAFARRLGRPLPPGATGFDTSRASMAKGVDERATERNRRAETVLAELCGEENDPALRVTARLRPYREADLADMYRAVPRSSPLEAAARHGSNEGDLAVVRLAVRFYAASFNAHGGRRGRSSLAAHLSDDVVPLLRETRGETVRRSLFVEASRLSFLLARMQQDASAHGLAQRHFTTALRLAAESRDRTAWAVVLRGLSSQALALGHRRAALHAAEAALGDGLGGPGGATGAYLLSQLSVAQAACGARRAALDSLGRAERDSASPASHADAAGPFTAYSPAALAYQSAEVFRHLGDLAAARKALDRSLARRPAEDHRGLALSHACRAEILVGSGYVEEACASWQSFLDHCAVLRSGTADNAVSRMQQLLAPFSRVPAAAAVLDRVPTSRPFRRTP